MNKLNSIIERSTRLTTEEREKHLSSMAEMRNHNDLELEEQKQLIKSPSADAFLSNPAADDA